MTPARLRWGLLLVQFGILILLVNLEVLNWNFSMDLLYSVPFFLIILGVEKIFTRSRLEFISYVAVGAMFLGGLYVAYYGSAAEGNPSFFEKTTFKKEFDASVNSIHAVLELGQGDLTIRDATDALVYGKFAQFTAKPKVEYNVVGGRADIELTRRSGRLFDGAIVIDADRDNDWTLYFCRSVPLEMECFGDKSDIHLNMSTTPLRKLDVDADDATIYVKIGDLEPFVELKLDGRDSDLRLRLPEGSGVRISGGEFASYLARIGLIDDGEKFISEGYDTLDNKIEINLDDRIDNLKLEFY
jgi:hypothetical protein